MEKDYLVCLSTFPSFGPARLTLLLSYFESAEKVWKAKESELREIGLRNELTQKFIQHRNTFNFTKYEKRLNDLSIRTITKGEKEYPVNLSEISDAPYVLYLKGNLKTCDIKSIGVVGSRKMTSYGKDVCELLVSELVHSGLTIVSGFARGIDTTAHKTALASGGRTIAVLAGGLDSIYPPENTQFAKEVIKNGALISEYPLGYPYLTTSFPHRNRIISGLSKGVLIIEAQKKSGTLWTATHAVSQNRTVFAVPGNITSFNSEAPNYLISQGAKMVLSSSDILSELGVDASPILQDTLFPVDYDEELLIKTLALEPLHLDELARISGVAISQVSSKLTVLELKGMVKHMGSGVYKRV